MPVGPLQLIDETSLSLGLKIAEATRAAMGEAYPDAVPEAVLQTMAEAGRLGRKAGAGFYSYDARGTRLQLWDGLATLFPSHTPQPECAEVQDRLLFIQALEAVRALDEGVLTDLREGDLGAVLGWGFAPWSGGPFSWLDRLGAAAAATSCDALAARHGPRFTCPARLRSMAATGQSFRERAG